MNKKNDMVFLYPLNPYRVNLKLVITENFQNICKQLYGEQKPGCQALTDYFKEDREVLVVLPLARNHGLIAHESLHAVMMLFEAIGVKVAVDNDEHATYLLEYIVNFIELKYEEKEENNESIEN